MRKRIRKKRHIGEFAMFGFPISVVVSDTALSDRVSDAVLGLLRERFWHCIGTLDDLFVWESRPGQRLSANRADFVSAVRELPGVADVQCGDVINLCDVNMH